MVAWITFVNYHSGKYIMPPPTLPSMYRMLQSRCKFNVAIQHKNYLAFIARVWRVCGECMIIPKVSDHILNSWKGNVQSRLHKCMFKCLINALRKIQGPNFLIEFAISLQCACMEAFADPIQFFAKMC